MSSARKRQRRVEQLEVAGRERSALFSGSVGAYSTIHRRKRFNRPTSSSHRNWFFWHTMHFEDCTTSETVIYLDVSTLAPGAVLFLNCSMSGTVLADIYQQDTNLDHGRICTEVCRQERRKLRIHCKTKRRIRQKSCVALEVQQDD